MGHKKLSGKIALVTGSSRGIGRAVVERMSREGASVVINYLSSSDTAEEIVAAITSDGGTAIALQADVSNIQGIRLLFKKTLTHFGRLDILVNNAGVRITRTVADTQEDEFPFFACQQAAHRISDGGRIINISSAVTRMMLPGYSIYAASKAAVDQLTRVLAKEMGGRQVTVNAIAPGPVDTELLREGKTEGQLQQMAQMAAFSRIGKVEDIADVVAFLASDDARWITGQIIHVNGGYI
jgi:3-oxoacyl-[acyl-carrier protein] reductase